MSVTATELAAEVKRLETELADVRAKQTDHGWILTLKIGLLFDSSGATLKPGAQRALDNLARSCASTRSATSPSRASTGFDRVAGLEPAPLRAPGAGGQGRTDRPRHRIAPHRRARFRTFLPGASNATETGRHLNRRRPSARCRSGKCSTMRAYSWSRVSRTFLRVEMLVPLVLRRTAPRRHGGQRSDGRGDPRRADKLSRCPCASTTRPRVPCATSSPSNRDAWGCTSAV